MKSHSRAFILVGLLGAWLPGRALAGIEYYYVSNLDPIYGISGHAFANENLGLPPMPTGPANTAYWSVWGQTDAAVSQSIVGWNLGDFTGATVPGPLLNYQVGYDPASYGGSAVEIHTETDGTTTYPVFGAMMNTWNYQRHIDPYDLAAAQVKYRWPPSEDKRPWAHGNTSVFHFSFQLQVPSVYVTPGARAYIGPVFTVDDMSQPGRYFWINLNVLDNTGDPNHPGVTVESISWDLGTGTAQVGSYLGNGTQYVTKASSSYSSTTVPWTGWRWYGFSVSYAQLQQMINDVNQKFPDSNFSTNPGDYRIGMLMIDAEIAWPLGNAYLGYSTYGISAYSVY
ncbi:hypothetical protein [Archangium violaceum]|uniref:hypothetical protein n=1 Tax=Archangium violaceum TaxID=83451 RepID=UPI001269DC91|nr:hypothetical protein [Archangium violaceum]